MGWQTTVTVQLLAGNSIINPSGQFIYSSSPAAGNLVVSDTPLAGGVSGTDQFGNIYLGGVTTYGSGLASQMVAGGFVLWVGSLSGGWSPKVTMATDAGGDFTISSSGTLALTGSVGVAITGTTTINGSGSTGAGDNGGVTSGPSGTVNAFPAAGPNHTHAEVHHHPL